MASGVILFVNVQISHEVVASNVPPADILKWHVEKAVRSIPDRVYGIDRRIIRCVALPPWDLWDIKQGGNHMDPLAMDVYSIRLYSRNIVFPEPPERTFMQHSLNAIPEGALLPPEYAAYFNEMPGRQPAANYQPSPMDVMALYNNQLLPGDKARIMLGLDKKGDK